MTSTTAPTFPRSPSSDPPELFHTALNPSRPSTLLLLHGLLSCHLEWSLLLPSLSSYHLLLVDLPGHSASSHFPPPYTIPRMSDAVARLILAHAHHGVAHVVGLSMGGFVVLDLVRRYPGLCLSGFVTGAAPFEGAFAFMARRPWVVYGFMWGMDLLPEWVYWWLAGGVTGGRRYEALRGEMRRNRRWEVVMGVYGSILESVGWEEVRGVKGVRVLCVAGGRQDDVKATRRVGEVWREEGVVDSRAVVVRGAVHAWNLQMPELFAEGIKAWVEGRELPGEFEELV